MDRIVFSNSIRLSGQQWLILMLFAVAIVVILPLLSKQAEGFTLETDYRVPHELSNDYWLFERYTELAVEQYDTLILGDSVVWGEYVTRQGTLSHYLNREVGQERFANLGLGGAHPLALTGLIGDYARSISNRNVILQCNPLWLSSPQADLQDDKLTQFNHPRLVPQFNMHIPGYKEEVSSRLGVLVERRLTFSKWANHVQQAYYEQSDIPSWTLSHPYDNPLQPLTRGLPAASNELRHLPEPWYRRGMTPQDYPWVELDTSPQWQGFQQTVATLQQRNNRVFVLVGPFNEHMLTPGSLERYQQIKTGIASWLKKKEIAHLIAEPLPSEQYGDASHPLAAGYRTLAQRLLASQGRL